MKRLLISLILILVAIYALFSVFGSGGEYTAEKLFFKAMKTYSKIAENPVARLSQCCSLNGSSCPTGVCERPTIL